MKRGDLVQTMFDVGANMGHRILYGKVIAAGPKTFTVRWESGLTNRCRHDHPSVKLARDQVLAKEVMG